MKKISILIVGIIVLCSNLFSQNYLLSTTYIRTYTKFQIDSVLDANGATSAYLNNKFTVDIYKLNYLCKDAFDTLVAASGLLLIPKDTCDLPVCSYNHGTVGKKSEAPSTFNGKETFIGMIMGSNGYLSIMPDYLGLGDGAGMHPYQHAKTEAYANIYMLKALKEYCVSNNINLNNQLFLCGYSQGGHAAMVTQRMIEKDFSTEFTVSACAPMSGAYDMSGTMVDLMLSNNPYPNPGYLPYLVLGWNPIYQMYPNISVVFKTPYNSTLPPLFDGTHTMGNISAHMPSVPKLIFDSTDLYNFTNNLSHPFRLALHENNAYTNWTPVAPMRMFYCSADTQVPYANSIVARDSLKAHGCATCDAFLVSATLDHIDCANYAFFMAKQYMDSIKYNACTINTTSVNKVACAGYKLGIYPNPASDIIYIDNSLGYVFEISICDLSGRVLYKEKNYENNKPIKIDFLDKGVYAIVIKSGTNVQLSKMFVKAR